MQCRVRGGGRVRGCEGRGCVRGGEGWWLTPGLIVFPGTDIVYTFSPAGIPRVIDYHMQEVSGTRGGRYRGESGY